MKTFLFVGLGNPGKEYERTRHNLGIRALRVWAQEVSQGSAAWRENDSLNAALAQVQVGDASVTCLFPLTYMNKSGQAVVAFLKNTPIELKNMLIIHDDVELPLGEVKVKEGGSAAGHKGVRSIHEALGTQDIGRLRLGIGRPLDSTPIDDYVLQTFSSEEEATVKNIITKAVSALNDLYK